jgi:hypothetical protein
MKYLRHIPLFAFILLFYNLLAFAGEGVLQHVLVDVPLMSGGRFVLDWGHFMILLGIIALYFEIIKSTHTSSSSIVDHGLSTLIFVIFLIEFITSRRCGTATFLILGFMALVDVIAGFTVTLSSAKRDFAFNTDNG